MVDKVREHRDPFSSPHLPELFSRAKLDGAKRLASFKDQLGSAQIEDQIHDTFFRILPELMNAEHELALFLVALSRDTISLIRRKDSVVVKDVESEESAGELIEADFEPVFRLDAQSFLAGLPLRDRSILIAVGEGEDRETIAREHKTTRANVDQVVSRARKKFREEDR